MAKLTDKCCSKCIDSEFQRCPKFTECLAQRPLAECHEDEKCVELRDAVIRKIRYGNGILLKLTACSYIPEVEIGALVNAIVTELRWRELTHVSLAVTGGLGNVADAPFLSVWSPEVPTIVYARVTPDMIPRIIGEHLEQQKIVEEWVLGQFSDDTKKLLDSVPVIQYLDFFHSQNLRASRRCGVIDPENLDEFFLEEGFLALSKALNRMTPDEIVNLIGVSGLRGRGGSSQLIAAKWKRMLLRKKHRGSVPSPQNQGHDPRTYLICNAHEGYHLSLKDRNLLESDPFGLIEGMVVTAYAIQATEGIIYLNPAYQLAFNRLQRALNLAREYHYLGKEILGTDFSFDIEIRRAPGGYLAGEETSIISFLEGDIGTRPVPPYPEESGLWGQPSLIHNVETFYHIALLVHHDYSWFTAAGLSDNPGTKCLTLAGAVARPGIIEIPLGISLREIIYGIGGGELPGQSIKAVHIGGPLGGYLLPEQWDVSFDHESLKHLNVRMGASTIEVLDQSVCIVNRMYDHFQQILQELCGQCTAGREGIFQIFSILQALRQREPIPGGYTTIQELRNIFHELTEYIQHASLCVYCEYATLSLVTAMEHFEREFEEHLQKRCKAGICF